jgi:hypothetical protein
VSDSGFVTFTLTVHLRDQVIDPDFCKKVVSRVTESTLSPQSGGDFGFGLRVTDLNFWEVVYPWSALLSRREYQQPPAKILLLKCVRMPEIILPSYLLFIIASSTRDIYPGSRIRIFSIPDFGSAIKEFKILTQKIVSKLSEYDPRCSSRIRILIFFTGSQTRNPGK